MTMGFLPQTSSLDGLPSPCSLSLVLLVLMLYFRIVWGFHVLFFWFIHVYRELYHQQTPTTLSYIRE